MQWESTTSNTENVLNQASAYGREMAAPDYQVKRLYTEDERDALRQALAAGPIKMFIEVDPGWLDHPSPTFDGHPPNVLMQYCPDEMCRMLGVSIEETLAPASIHTAA